MAWAVLEVLGESFVVADPGRSEAENRLPLSVVVPELLASLHTLVQLFHPRFDRAAGDRQARAAVTRVVHPFLILFQVATLSPQNAPGMLRLLLGFWRWCQATASVVDVGQDVLDPALPAQRGPTPSQLGSLARRTRRFVNMFGGVDKIQDRLERFKMAALDRPIISLAIADKCLGGRCEEAVMVQREMEKPGSRIT
jgi:hypothetical protein